MREQDVANKEKAPGEQDSESAADGTAWTRVLRRGEEDAEDNAQTPKRPASVGAGGVPAAKGAVN